MSSFAKIFIILGSIFLLIGLILFFFDKIPYFGKLPGDILIKKKNFTLYFPITTMILLSIILSIIMWFIRK
ncbi:MAG: DUF2905 domain-containing protein [Candidatus Margulisbacteria bacterium]|nr:DUF2905 domain-containing protein [Candidatus Margulisiibacteriota bacterium]